MECGLGLKKGSSGHTLHVTSEKKILTQESQRSNPQNKFRDDKRGVSYADLHREITKNVQDVYPKHLDNRVNARIGRTSSGERELLKYKSYVPSYTKVSEKFQDKVTKGGGFGLQDRDKWRCADKQIRNKSTGPSVSSTSTSSSFWTDKSSTDSSRGQCLSPRQRMNHPPLQFYLMSSRPGSYSQVHKPPGENGATFEVYNSSRRTTGKEWGSSILPNERDPQSPSAAMFRQHERKDSNFKIVPTSGTSSNLTMPNVPSFTRVISKSQADDFKKKGEKMEERNRNSRVHDVSGKEKTAAVFVPGIVSQKQFIGLSKFFDSKVLLAERVAEANQKGLPDWEEYRRGAVADSDASLSCPFPREPDGYRASVLKRISFISLEKTRYSSERSRSAPRSTKAESSPSRGRTLDRRQTLTPFKQAGQTSPKVPSERARSISPFRRLSFSIGKSSKSSSSKDAQTPPRVSMASISSRPSSDDQSCSSGDSSSFDKTSASRGRSSPLRRLLEPLMKPKASNTYKSPEPSQNCVPLSHHRPILSDSQPSSSNLPPRNGGSLSTVQALFRITSKNDQPLFTFAVDKEQNITAATIRKRTPQEKDESSYKYMFFTVQEAKKSGKWINHGGKSQCQEYTSNVVAHMRVSGSQPSTPMGLDNMDHLISREFVVFASNSHQTNELAAVVIKIPKVVERSSTKDSLWSDKRSDTREIPFGVYLKDISATIILPSGIHSLPHKGGPSSLIQRWISGGACDCGGWDMGCNLRILTNQHQPIKTSCSSEPPSTSNGFKLFFQAGGLQHNGPFLSFSPYKDGIYAVEFSSSLSALQAFSICIAVNDGRNLSENTSGERVLIQNERLKSSSSSSAALEGDAPSRYISYPPDSPVGRV